MKVILVAFSHLFFLFSVASSFALRETGCPPADKIEPCTCYSDNSLECMDVNHVETLRTIFANSEMFTYSKINISFSSLQYLPHDMFEKTAVSNLILHNVTLVELFDSPPEGLDAVYNLHIENLQLSREMTWDLLQNFTQLKLLSVYFTPIPNLDTTFSHYVTKNLEQLIFYGTETRRIKPGVLVDFVNLTKVAVDSCQLKTLTRNAFPHPFNVRELSFNDNRITSIPGDLFSAMPNLQTLGLRNNIIASIPESAFRENIRSITHVWFDGNPLKCDCLLNWIVIKKPHNLRGNCAAPKRLHGKELKDLTDTDFNC